MTDQRDGPSGDTLPSFAAVVGAPRCGTTAISRYIRAHPDVCFAKPKEPHFFILNDFHDVADNELRERVDRDYLDRFFGECRDNASMLAEGSVSYLYAADKMDAILRIWPEAKFIISVRDPLQLLPSIHQRLLYQGDENVRDFDKAWRLTKVRAEGKKIPRSCLDPRLLRYDEVGRLGANVEAFFNAVGRERCLVVVYDDIAADADAVFEQVRLFLGLKPFVYQEERRRRESRGFRFGWLQRLLKRPPVVTRAVLAGEQFRRRVAKRPAKQPGAVARGLMSARKRLIALNQTAPPPPSMSDEVRSEIRALLSPDIDRLATLIGRDLSHWLGRSQPN
ncbi:sulfotransferase [Sphingomonas piscis]|uniref:Sulfotransferase n=1 Tax=Sphingomonas piscis TaxID=2714943 RepID=A0A6G7YQR2_9SPHN|nr:sulfotransferase [Sphingomonas piscis]QIK79081.1 sulfotransferase [Sphingomonas piscis]